MKTLKTREEARRELDRKGMSVADWCRTHQVNLFSTYQFLRGRNKGLRGESHRIAVLLGVKDGVI